MSFLPSGSTISVVIMLDEHIDTVEQQIKSVVSQTVTPIEIIIWNNSTRTLNIDGSQYTVPINVFTPSRNMGVWAPFFAAFNCIGNYLCLLEEKAILDGKWFQTCLECMKVKEAMYGVSGLRLTCQSDQLALESVYSRDQPSEVDVLRYAWFLKREWLHYITDDLPDIIRYSTCGADIHLSHILKKYGNIKSCVVPDAINNHSGVASMFGNNQDACDYWINVVGYELANNYSY